MISYPLDAIEAQIHMRRLKSRDAKIVGSNGNFFIREERVVKCKNGIEADVVVLHGKAQGRHTHSKSDRRVIGTKSPKTPTKGNCMTGQYIVDCLVCGPKEKST